MPFDVREESLAPSVEMSVGELDDGIDHTIIAFVTQLR
jgi:hypothetical protein